MQALWKLLVSFALIGLGAYGGGLVAIPLIQHEIVSSRHWISFDEMARLMAISQMTPGPIAINAATFVGYIVSGVAGAAVATLAVVAPSLLILVWLAPGVDRFRRNAHAIKFRHGIQVGVLSLILFAAWSYGSAAIGNRRELALAAAAFLALVVFERKVHPAFIILAGGIAGWLMF